MTHSILVVDDEPNIALSLEYIMARDGYEVRTARDGQEALDEVSTRRPDLILLDVMMPKHDGFEVCQKVRGDAGCAGVKIVMLTAKAGALDGEKAMALGADAFFTKPFSIQEVSLRVRELLGASGDEAA